MMRFLVTGGCGFIGRHLVRALLDEGLRVTVADRHLPNASLAPWTDREHVEFVQIDLTDTVETADLIRRIGPDVIYHLAAQPLSTVSNIEPLDTVKDNILATYSLLEAVRKYALHCRLVHASSACFYGVPISEPPLRETDCPAVGHYIYTATKIAADFAVQHYRHIYNLDCISARMVNVYGPGDLHHERVVPRLVLQALAGEPPSLTQSDGSDVLSFLYVSDAVAALHLLGTDPRASRMPVWNIPGSPPLSVFELMGEIYDLVGRPTSSFAAIGSRRGAPVHKYLDGAMIRRELGFSPSIDLDSGLKQTIEWYRRHTCDVSFWQEGMAFAKA